MHAYMVEYTYKNKARGNTPKEIKNGKGDRNVQV